jgi:ribosomal protein S18 acetylase RimI-like enzyme
MLTIRRAKESDIPRLLDLYRQLSFRPDEYQAAPVANCRKIFRKMQKVPGYELLVVKENSEVIGTAVLAILPGFAHNTSPFAVVEWVVVHEMSRGRGIGWQLMQYIIERAKKAGCYKIMLTSDLRRERAHKFYKSIGFEASAHGFRMYL